MTANKYPDLVGLERVALKVVVAQLSAVLVWLVSQTLEPLNQRLARMQEAILG